MEISNKQQFQPFLLAYILPVFKIFTFYINTPIKTFFCRHLVNYLPLSFHCLLLYQIILAIIFLNVCVYTVDNLKNLTIQKRLWTCIQCN